MTRRALGVVAACVVVLAIAAPALPESMFGEDGLRYGVPFTSLSEAALMALLGTGLVALASSVARRKHPPQ